MPPPPPAPTDAAPLPLHVVARQAFLWTPADIAAARAAHHIAPMLQGTLPMLAQQNLFCGPPAGLMHEEAVCLVGRRAAVLIASPESHDAPSTSQAAAYHEARRADIAAQRAATRASSSAARSKQLTSTRAAQEKREARAARRAAAGEAPEEEARPASPAPPQLDDEEISYSHLTPALPDGDWYAPEPHTYTTLAAARKAGVWTFPADLRERARSAVFEEMHRCGYFLNCGLRFGGDFNAYPGDPLRYHSHFTVQVLATPTTPLPAQQLVASGRLGTAVKKAHLLAVVDGAEEADEEGKAKSPQVTFWSLTWAGFGT